MYAKIITIQQYVSLKHVSVNKTSQHKKDKTNIFRRPSLNDKYLVCAKIRQEIRQIDLNQDRMFSGKAIKFQCCLLSFDLLSLTAGGQQCTIAFILSASSPVAQYRRLQRPNLHHKCSSQKGIAFKTRNDVEN